MVLENYLFFTLICCVALQVGVTAKLPDAIPKCRRSDPQFNDCLRKSTLITLNLLVNGSKALGIPKLEPLFVTKMYLGDSGNPGQFKLTQRYENINIFGITSAALPELDASFTADDCHWSFVAINEKVRMEADYILKGQVLIFPLNGNGKCVNTLDNLWARHEMKCERYENNGKYYFKVKEYKLTMKPENIHYQFENIIPGNEQLSNDVAKTINENAMEVFATVKTQFEESYAIIYKSIINGIFSKVSENELFLD